MLFKSAANNACLRKYIEKHIKISKHIMRLLVPIKKVYYNHQQKKPSNMMMPNKKPYFSSD